MMPHRGFGSAELQPHPSLGLLVLQIFVRRCCGTSLKVLDEDVVALPTTCSTTSLVLNQRAWLQPGSSEGSTRSTIPNLDISVVRNVGASCLFYRHLYKLGQIISGLCLDFPSLQVGGKCADLMEVRNAQHPGGI